MLVFNTANRSPSEPKTIQYAKDIQEGRWMENGDGVAIAKCGSLNNGQHRCQAVLLAGVGIMTNVTVGLERKARETNDIGLQRTLANILAMAGFANHSIIGPMAKLIMGWEETGTAAKRPTRESSPSRVQEFISTNPTIMDSAVFIRSISVPKNVLSKPQVGFFHNVLMKHDPANAETFMKALVMDQEDGRGLCNDDPRRVAHNRLREENKIIEAPARAELVFRAWNAWREGRSITHLKVTGTLPPLV
jgi:hypothetical protein